VKGATKPSAVWAEPVVRLKSALPPSAVFWLGYPPSGAGPTARATGDSTSEPTPSVTRRQPCHNGDRKIRLGMGRIATLREVEGFIVFRRNMCAKIPSCSGLLGERGIITG